jgi:S-adenosylmethionine:tRNA ribosyltransferase-isomerase
MSEAGALKRKRSWLRRGRILMPTAALSTARFELPPELEAREPAEVRGRGRDDVRMLVTRGNEGREKHVHFADLPQFLSEGDLVVLNASATMPAALSAQASNGKLFALHVSTQLPDGRSIVEPRDHVPNAGESVQLAGGAALTFATRYRDSPRLWTGRFENTGDIVRYLHRWGKPIAYRHVLGNWPIETYQNVFAAVAGSAEMASAGRPFTRALLDRLAASGVTTAYVLLHTGVSSPERDEPPYEEFFRVSGETAALVARTRAAGKRVIAVGTTSVRALESAVDDRGRIIAGEGWTDLIITPERGMRFVDGMITGFHEPRSTHLSLLEALVGKEHVARAYSQALTERYLWHEFGDSHFLVR